MLHTGTLFWIRTSSIPTDYNAHASTPTALQGAYSSAQRSLYTDLWKYVKFLLSLIGEKMCIVISKINQYSHD